MEEKKYFTTKEAADRLNYSIENVYRLTFAGRLVPKKMYNRNFYTDEELTRFENERKQKMILPYPSCPFNANN